MDKIAAKQKNIIRQTRLKFIKGDIITLRVDAIVNAANSSLTGGGGVDGAIHNAVGPALFAACRKIRKEQYPDGLPVGEAVISPGFNLPAKFIIHTVGPMWQDGMHHEPQLLAKCYQNCLLLAKKNGLKTIAFPAISTGAYAYPKDKAKEVALKAVTDFIKNDNSLDEIIFVQHG